MSLRGLAIILATSVIAACGMLSSPRELRPLPLLPPGELGKDLQLSQRVSVSFEDEQNTFLGAWTVAAERLDFVGLTPSGQRLLTLSYDGRDFAEHYSPMLKDEIPGREVLSHLQLAHWPISSIDAHLAGTGWRLDSSGGERLLYFKNHLILSIAAGYDRRGPGELPPLIRIESHIAPYRLEVKTLQVVEQ